MERARILYLNPLVENVDYLGKCIKFCKPKNQCKLTSRAQISDHDIKGHYLLSPGCLYLIPYPIVSGYYKLFKYDGKVYKLMSGPLGDYRSGVNNRDKNNDFVLMASNNNQAV